ncbi:MAG TPA: HAD-IC family P-type ATPase, partial [Gammaproteobacteria bacterium]|nr:HAD-IC family P-type ATPase [Gammaproteobacteria bacterium]
MQDDRRNNGVGTDWHAWPAEAVLATFASGKHGLSSAEAQARLARYGPNRLPSPPRRSPLRRFLTQFNNLLLYVLLVAAAITALLRQFTDAGVILAVCIANAIIGFVQEGRAERALQAIRAMLSPQAQVMRDGRRLDLPAAALVPGDLVLLNAGDRVPADLRLVWVKNLQSQEAALTGESVPVSKQPAPVAADAALGDRTCMAYSGTLVTVGQGRGVVVATGAGTELGRISGMLAAVEAMETPLLRQMRVFARRLTSIILLLAVLLFSIGVGLWAYPLTDMFMAVVSLAVAAIPEGLPVILTIAMAIGVQRMAGRNAVIRRLPAVEALGSVSVICTDKTGTLTRNEMTVRTVVTAAHQYEVTGVGHQPHGEFLLHGAAVSAEHRPLLHEMVRAAALCNDAALMQNAVGEWEVTGDPMEGALLTIARKIGLEPAQERSAYPRTDVIPFDARYKFMTTLHHDQRGAGVIYLKGAPEQVLELCTRQRVFDGSDQPLELRYWQARIEGVAQAGQRVLAIAARQAAGHRELHLDSLGDGLILLGLFGLIDPPREEAIAAIADCQSAGIRVKMITGDHAATALAVAGQLGLANTERVLTGPEIARVDSEELRALVLAVDVFARASPEHKLRLVEALQAQGHVVAMTG